MTRFKLQVIRQFIGVGLFFLSAVTPAFAISAPTFPTCPNPEGTQIASYADGTHGIPGRMEAFVGSDTVFRIDETRVVQCYCAPDGQGIQTNWWKVTSLTADEKGDLTKQGWIYIPDGSLWGLDSGDWMAKNIILTCGEKGAGSSSNSSSSGSSNSVVTTITQIIPQILGFADTGRRRFYRSMVALAGVTSISVGILVFVLTPREKKK